jgi:hypothetical protein
LKSGSGSRPRCCCAPDKPLGTMCALKSGSGSRPRASAEPSCFVFGSIPVPRTPDGAGTPGGRSGGGGSASGSGLTIVPVPMTPDRGDAPVDGSGGASGSGLTIASADPARVPRPSPLGPKNCHAIPLTMPNKPRPSNSHTARLEPSSDMRARAARMTATTCRAGPDSASVRAKFLGSSRRAPAPPAGFGGCRRVVASCSAGNSRSRGFRASLVGPDHRKAVGCDRSGGLADDATRNAPFPSWSARTGIRISPRSSSSNAPTSGVCVEPGKVVTRQWRYCPSSRPVVRRLLPFPSLPDSPSIRHPVNSE